MRNVEGVRNATINRGIGNCLMWQKEENSRKARGGHAGSPEKRQQCSFRLLKANQTKAGIRRSVPLNEMLRQAIVNRRRFRAKHCPASPWVFAREGGTRIKAVKRSFNTACRRAGIEGFHIHDLRHTCAAWLVGFGVPLTEVRDLLGHASVVVTERYAHLSPDNVRAAVARLDEAMSR